MATEAQINAICGLYVAYFDRAADPEGLQFWIDQLDNGRDFATISQDFANSQEARDIYPFLNNPDVASPGAFITAIYANLFDRAPESEGLQFWTNVLESGAVAPGDMVEAILLGARDDIVDGELVQDATIVANKIEAAKYYTEEAANTPGFEFDQTAYDAARAAISGVDATEESVVDSRFDTDNFIGQAGNQASNIHTLMEQKILVSPEVVTEQLVTNTVTFWGFNPHSHDETEGVDNLDGNDPNGNDNNLTNEGPEDGGVPLSDLLNYFQALAGTDLFEMDTIDTDAGDFPDLSGVTDITLSGPANTDASGDGADASGGNNVDVNNGGGTLTLHYDDFEADIALGQEYFDLLHSLIFDEEGNSRLFQKEVAADVPVYIDEDGNVTLDSNGNGDPIGTIDAVLTTVEDAVYATIPAILTNTQNNGSTAERAFTDGEDDTIVAGRLELLHNAYIDAGLGYNTLEIDAKGYFAQPKELLNIQQINIHQLPNIYTDDLVDEDGDGELDLGAENLFPNISLDGAFDNDSIIDLSRATSLEALTLTQGDFEDLDVQSVEEDPGDLTVTGIRNGAIATIDGHWAEGDLRLNYSALQGDGVHVVFNNLHMDDSSDLEIGHNATKLTIESTGGGNYIYDGNLVGDDAEDGGVNTLIITGDAHLHIEDDMDYTFSDDTPITVDASANTGGVDLNFTHSEKVTFIGSQANDRLSLSVEDSDIDQGPSIDDDQEVVIEGGVGDNYYNIETDDKLTITNADGNNNYEIDANTASVTAGNGNNFLQGYAAHLTAAFGDGDNRIDLELDDGNDEAVTGLETTETGANITLGDGANHVTITTSDDLASLDDGSGGYSAFVGSGGSGGFATENAGGAIFGDSIDMPEINITAGDGGNTIRLPQLPVGLDGSSSVMALTKINVTTGDGDDTILAAGAEITISSGGGDDEITLLGVSNDVVTEFAQLSGDTDWTPASGGYNGLSLAEDGTFLYNGFAASTFGAKIDIDTGPGSATINLGAFNDSLGEVSGNIVADEGSSITGEDITLFVNTHADLRAASLDGITRIIMDDDSSLFAGLGSIGDGGESEQDTAGEPGGDVRASNIASLTLLDSQVAALGAGIFSTQGATFGAQSVLNIVITEDTELSDLINLGDLDSSVKLAFVVQDGATLTMTAEELHTYVAPNGIAVDELNGFIDNQVVITDAGFDFDAYNNQNGGLGGGTIAGAGGQQDVSIIRTPDGYVRPSQDDPSDSITVDSDVTPVVENIMSFFAKELVIEGDADLEITGRVDLGDNFTIDFTGFNGEFPENADGVEEAMTIYNFQDITADVNTGTNTPNDGMEDTANPYSWGRIDGNGTNDDPVRINVVMQSGTSAGDSDYGVAKGGIFSSGVQQYVLTGFVDKNGYDVPQSQASAATIVVCDHTEDLEVLGLQNNRNAKVTFEQVNWTTDILMEGDGFADSSEVKNFGNPDLSQVGYVVANFFEPGINASVRITNQGTELGQNEDALDGFDPDGERKLEVAGITVNNADRLLINVEDGDAVINDVTGEDVERVIVNGPEDVELVIAGTENPSAAMMSGLDSSDLKSIDGSGVGGEFTLAFTENTDLSGVDLTGVDKIVLRDDGTVGATTVTLTLNGDQVEEFQGKIVNETSTDTAQLVVVDMADQAVDMGAIDVDNIGTVTFVDEAVTVNPATNFGDADGLILPADSQVTMTVAQFMTADGGGDGEPNVTDAGDTVASPETAGTDDVTPAGANEANNKLILTDVSEGDPLGTPAMSQVSEVELTDVSEHVDVDIVLNDFTANANFDISAGGGETTTILAGGTTDLSAGALGTTDAIQLQDGADVTLSAAQLVALTASGISLAPGATATLNVNGMSTEALDLDALVAANPGLSIGTVTLIDTDSPYTVDPTTTFGGANVVTEEDGEEDGESIISMTVNQYETTSGSVSGDLQVNFTNWTDEDDDLDLSGVTTPTGTIAFDPAELTIDLVAAANLNGFEILLDNGQMIQFATEEQAAATVTESDIDMSGGTIISAIGWLFETVTGPVDTSGYDSDIETLYIKESLLEQVGGPENEEDLWTFLSGSTKVEKVNDGLPDVLIGVNRVNTFQAFTSNDGVIYDDQNEFQTIANLTMNLEGNTSIGDVGIGDTVVPNDPNNPGSIFDTLYINSYLDEESTQFPFGDPGAPDGIIFLPNRIGDVFLNAGSADEITNIEIRTFDVVGTLGSGDNDDTFVAPPAMPMAPNYTTVDPEMFTTDGGGFHDMANVGDQDGAERDGLAIETGVLTFAANSPTIGNLLVSGANDATIGGVDITDPEVTLVDVNALTHTGDLEIGTIGDFFDLDPFGHIYIADGHTSGPDDLADSGMNALVIAGGDNDFTAETTLDIDNVHVTGAGTTLTLTADQVASIGIADGDSDGVADNWTIAPGASITLNITEFDTQSLDLNKIAAAGFDIGTITTDDTPTSFEIDPLTTFGMADAFNILVDTSDTTVEMTAAQYQTIENGNVGEQLTPNAVANDFEANIHIDELEGIEASPVDIDLTTVNVSGDKILAISEFDGPGDPFIGDGDVTLSDTSLLGDFAIRLWDTNDSVGVGGPDELNGETIRFTTQQQADGRVILVAGEDDNANPNSDLVDGSGVPISETSKDEKDTNVVWAFDVIAGGSPGLDVSGYDGMIGRIWLPEALVDSVGGDVDSLFTVDDGGTPDFTLDSDIIKRIEAGDLAELLLQSVAISQRVEITSYTNTNGLEFEVDDPLVDLAELRIDFGGVTDIGNLELDNILGPVNPDNPNFPGDDDFGTLTLNSLIGNFYNSSTDKHYLLPDEFDPANNPLPSDDGQILDQSNNAGDILSGADRGVLRDVVINTFDRDNTDTPVGGTDEGPADFVNDDGGIGADGDGNGDANMTPDDAESLPSVEGAAFNAQTIYFSDDGDTTAAGGTLGDPTANLVLTGENDVTVKSLDTSDADITALVVDTTDYTGTFTITGGSPAFDGDSPTDDTTTNLTFVNSAKKGVDEDDDEIFLASSIDDNGTPMDFSDDTVNYNTGVGEPAPYAGVSSGALTDIDTTGHDGVISLGVISQVNSDDFTLDTGETGQLYACLGEALDDGTETPTLNAAGVWTFDGEGGGRAGQGANNLDLEMKAANLGAGTLVLNDVDVTVTGDIDFTGLDTLTVSGSTTINVAAGATLKLTVAQVDALQTAGINIFGEGKVEVTGESDGSVGTIDTDFSNLNTAEVDLSAVTLAATDPNDALDIRVTGAEDGTGGALLVGGVRVAQTIIGSANNDAVTIDSDASDGDDTTIDVITRLGGDSGTIGDPNATPTDNTATDTTPEEVGDVITREGILASNDTNVQVEVDAGFDTYQSDITDAVPIGTAGATVGGLADGDVVKVSSGAEFYANGVAVSGAGGFTATADTTNDGTAVIEADLDETIDVSAAGGANGWSLIGGSDAATAGGSNLVTGSDQDDNTTLVDGAASGTDNTGQEDTFTGGPGADVFEFNHELSTPTAPTPNTTTMAVDEETITVTGADGNDEDNEQIVITYSLNGVATALTVDNTPPLDTTSTGAVASAIASAFNGLAGVSASATGDDVSITGDNGNSVEVLSVTVNNPAGGGLAVTEVSPPAPLESNTAQVTDITIASGVQAGEVYKVVATLAEGQVIGAEYEATGADTATTVATGLAAAFEANANSIGATNVTAGSAGAVVTFTADNGGFTLTTAVNPAVIATSASSFEGNNGGAVTFANANADTITDFVTTEDSIDLNAVAGDGNGSNYVEAPETADYATALSDADTAMDGTVAYYLTSTAADGGLLFFDADGNGSVDGVVSLPGVDESTFEAGDIMG